MFKNLNIIVIFMLCYKQHIGKFSSTLKIKTTNLYKVYFLYRLYLSIKVLCERHYSNKMLSN